MKNNEIFFLHFGPGGNSDVERFFLGKTYQQIHFWDQPQAQTFAELVDASSEAYTQVAKEVKNPSIVAHSFGCDIAVAVAKKLKLKQNIFLVAPVHDLASAFKNLAALILEQAQLSGDVAAEIRNNLKRYQSEPQLKYFWELVFSLYKFPEIGTLFWKNQITFKKYLAHVSEFKPVNLQTWQTILGGYMGAEAAKTYESTPLKELKLNVLLGANDPYFEGTKSRVWWSSKIRAESVRVADNTAHYPHLEDAVTFATLLS